MVTYARGSLQRDRLFPPAQRSTLQFLKFHKAREAWSQKGVKYRHLAFEGNKVAGLLKLLV